jgi:hypothetical protein
MSWWSFLGRISVSVMRCGDCPRRAMISRAEARKGEGRGALPLVVFGTGGYFTPTSSTSKTRVALGGMTPGKPRSP